MSHWRNAGSEAQSYAQKLTEDERRIAESQISKYEVFAAASDRNRWLYGARGSRAVVCIPPRSSDGGERWVAIDPLSHDITTAIEQPDPDRTVVYVCENSWETICYFYSDQLPCCIAWTIIATIFFSIFTTPVILLCCIPMIYNMFKAKKNIEDGEATEGRKVYKSCCCWCIGPAAWISAIFPLVIAGIILGIVFAVI